MGARLLNRLYKLALYLLDTTRFNMRQSSVYTLLALVSLGLSRAYLSPSNDHKHWVSPIAPTHSSRSPFFRGDLVLPPLPTASSTSGRSKGLPVVYTNDPKQVKDWLETNIPSHGCALGFDVEVSTVVAVGASGYYSNRLQRRARTNQS